MPAPTDAPAARYPAAFEDVWERTGKRGSKHPALVAWRKANSPPWSALSVAWTAYLRSDAPVRLGAVQHLSTWLNAKGWAQEWPPAGPPVRRIEPAKTSAPTYAAPTSSCFSHSENPRCHTKRITPGCPECREQQAREAGRVVTEDEMLESPPWMAVAGKP